MEEREGKRAGLKLCEEFIKLLEQYGLKSKVIGLTTDIATNNDVY